MKEIKDTRKDSVETKIFNVNVYGLNESLIASGYPMIADHIGDMDEYYGDVLYVDEKDIKRGKVLGNVPTGTGHDNYLKGIVVQFDITYPVYWSPQFQRYHFADIVSSTSAMHKIHKVNLNETTNKYVSRTNNERLSKWIDIYNEMLVNKKDSVIATIGNDDDFVIKHYLLCEHSEFVSNENSMGEYKKSIPTEMIENSQTQIMSKEYIYMKIISNLPQGLMKTMRITTSYLQLKTIYQQRKHHKLKDDWGVFCDWCIELPYFRQLCTKEEPKNV